MQQDRWKPRLRWRKTWSDREDDFAAEAPDHSHAVGRIYKGPKSATDSRWFWSMTAFGHRVTRIAGATSGWEPSAREAARRMEGAWEAAKSPS
jgi:hypothetical protein